LWNWSTNWSTTPNKLKPFPTDRDDTVPSDQGIKASAVRTFGFIKREVLGIFRQPRLILTLIIAPFAILLIFGLGYRTQPPPFDTLLVLPSEDARFATDDEFLSDAFGDSINLVGTTSDVTQARSRLRSGDVDLLIIGPADAISSLEEGEEAEFLVVHSEVDPVIRSSIRLLARLSVEELNRLVLTEIVDEAQSESELVEQPLDTLSSQTDSLVQALERGDSSETRAARDAISESIDRLEAETMASGELFNQVSEALGTEQTDPFDDLRSSLDATDGQDSLESAREFEENLGEFESRFEQIRTTDPDLLVSPFGVSVEDIANLPTTPALFYAPGTLVVLMQHLAITFAALSLVRERQLGLTELFRVSPLKPAEILIGKFVAFIAMAGLVAATLTGTMLAFGVPLRGDPWMFVLTIVLVIVASLGLGFALSAAADTDSQAVQYTMIVLLVSIFFTGFVLPLDQLIPPVRIVSYLIPGTYGIAALQDVMFRGLPPNLLIIGGLGLYCIVVIVASWFVMRRHVRSTA
jgi:ABC-2 type transport system permease protein